MNPEQLESEIKELQRQINLVEKEQIELQKNLPSLTSQNLSDLVVSAKASAVALAETQPKLKGLEDAHNILTRQLAAKQAALTKFQAEQQRQQRQERVKVGRAKIQDQAKKIHALADQLEAAFLELKALHQEFGGDHRALQPNPTGSLAWSPKELIEFRVVQTPLLLEQGARFVLSTRRIDLFEPERQVTQHAQLQKEAEVRRRREADRKAWEIQQAADAKRREIERLQGVLFGKRQELEFFERQVKELISQGYRKRGSNLRLDDTVLDRLKTEIQELEGQLKQVQE